MFRLVTVKTLPSLSLRTDCGKSFGEPEAGEAAAKLQPGLSLTCAPWGFDQETMTSGWMQ